MTEPLDTTALMPQLLRMFAADDRVRDREGLPTHRVTMRKALGQAADEIDRLAAELTEVRQQLAAAKPQEPPQNAAESILSAEHTPKAPADTPDPADDHTALGEYPPLTTGCDFAGGKHLLNSDNVCVRCETEVPDLPRRLLDSLNRTNGPRPETPRSLGPYDDPPADIRDAPASYTTEPPQ